MTAASPGPNWLRYGLGLVIGSGLACYLLWRVSDGDTFIMHTVLPPIAMIGGLLGLAGAALWPLWASRISVVWWVGLLSSLVTVAILDWRLPHFNTVGIASDLAADLSEARWREILAWALLAGAAGAGLVAALRSRFQLGTQRSHPPEEEPVRLHCNACKRQPLDNALLHPVSSFGSSKRIYLCSRCWRRRQRRKELLLLLIVTGSLVATALRSSPVFPRALLNLALVFVFSVLLVVPHELGHALAGWLVGARLFRIYIGLGLSIYDGRRWGPRWEPRLAQEMGGFVSGGFPELRRLRLKSFIYVLGGPLANALLLAVSLWWLTLEGFLKGIRIWEEKIQPLHVVALANVSVLLTALWPCRLKMWGFRLETDGLLLLTIPFLSPKQIRQHHALYFLLEAVDCLQHKEPEAARRWLSRLPASYLMDPDVLHTLAAEFLRGRDFAQARQCWRSLLALPDLDSASRMSAWDARATTDLLLLLDDIRTLDGVDLLEEADSLTQAALAEVRQAPELIASLFGTRGGVLIEQRKYDEGEQLLRAVIAETEDASIKAICICYLAVAAARRGDGQEAATQLDTARALDAQSPFLEGATRQVTQGNGHLPSEA